MAYHAELRPGDYVVVNGPSIDLEDCKVTQLLKMRSAGSTFPGAVSGKNPVGAFDLVKSGLNLEYDSPFVCKPVRGGAAGGRANDESACPQSLS